MQERKWQEEALLLVIMVAQKYTGNQTAKIPQKRERELIEYKMTSDLDKQMSETKAHTSNALLLHEYTEFPFLLS